MHPNVVGFLSTFTYAHRDVNGNDMTDQWAYVSDMLSQCDGTPTIDPVMAKMVLGDELSLQFLLFLDITNGTCLTCTPAVVHYLIEARRTDP